MNKVEQTNVHITLSKFQHKWSNRCVLTWQRFFIYPSVSSHDTSDDKFHLVIDINIEKRILILDTTNGTYPWSFVLQTAKQIMTVSIIDKNYLVCSSLVTRIEFIRP